MPRTPSQLKAKEPPTRDPRVPAELWPLPQRVALRGNELGLSQQKLAELSGVKQPKISKLLAYQDLHTLDASFVILLARALDLSIDELLTGRRPRVVFDAPAPSSTPVAAPHAVASLAK